MRHWLISCAAALVAVSCNSASKPDAGPVDLSSTVSGPDLSVSPAPTGCRGYLQCRLDCGLDATCASNCDKDVTAQGQNLYFAAITCGQNWCLGINDMGSGDCMLNDAGTKLIDANGRPANSCRTCLSNALAKLLAQQCTEMGPGCNPSSCSASANACLADTP